MAKYILPREEDFCKLPRAERRAIIDELLKMTEVKRKREVSMSLGVVVEFGEN
jgi:hypothetical protein